MAAYKVINLDSPIESDYWVDIPVRDPATNKDAVDEQGRILVERHVTRSVKNEEMSTINAAVETVNTLKEDYSTFKEEVSTKVNTHDSSILTNTNNITTLTDSVTNHDLQINALYTKINAIQGIDIDDFKYVTETDIKNIKKDYLPLAGGTVTGDLVLSGKVSSNSPIKANLQGTADRAIGDINGKALTSYIANLKVSGASITVANGAGKTSNYTVDNINHANHAKTADSATNATNCTSKVNSSLTTVTHISGNQGNVLVNSNASAGAYTMLTKLNSTNGIFTEGCYQNNYLLQYTTNATVNAGVNAVTKSITLLNENGDSAFCGTVYAPTFHGTLNGNATNANHAKTADSATNATNANHATSADRATNATNASHATNATNADKLDGLHASTSIGANTVVARDVNGIVNFNYINSNTYNNENPPISQIIVTNGSDNYYRKASLAHLKNSMGIATEVVPTGAVIFVAMDSTPSGFLLCNGGAVSRITYSALFAKIGTKYGAGNGSTTFNLPNLIDRFVQGNATAGTYKSAGLPNITGSVLETGNQWQGASGAFKLADNATTWVHFSTAVTTPAGFSFNASRSNSIYGKSTTVQPPALTLRPIIKY